MTEDELKEEVRKLEHFKRAIIYMCSYRMSDVDDYIRMAKQTHEDYHEGRDVELRWNTKRNRPRKTYHEGKRT